MSGWWFISGRFQFPEFLFPFLGHLFGPFACHSLGFFSHPRRRFVTSSSFFFLFLFFLLSSPFGLFLNFFGRSPLGKFHGLGCQSCFRFGLFPRPFFGLGDFGSGPSSGHFLGIIVGIIFVRTIGRLWCGARSLDSIHIRAKGRKGRGRGGSFGFITKGTSAAGGWRSIRLGSARRLDSIHVRAKG